MTPAAVALGCVYILFVVGASAFAIEQLRLDRLVRAVLGVMVATACTIIAAQLLVTP